MCTCMISCAQRKVHVTSNGSMAEEMITLPDEKFNSVKDDEYKEAPQYDEIQTRKFPSIA